MKDKKLNLNLKIFKLLNYTLTIGGKTILQWNKNIFHIVNTTYRLKNLLQNHKILCQGVSL